MRFQYSRKPSTMADRIPLEARGRPIRQKMVHFEKGATVLMVTHDVFSACYCERILFLSDGKICAELNRGSSNRRDYLDCILDIQSQIGGEDIYAE